MTTIGLEVSTILMLGKEYFNKKQWRVLWTCFWNGKFLSTNLLYFGHDEATRVRCSYNVADMSIAWEMGLLIKVLC